MQNNQNNSNSKNTLENSLFLERKIIIGLIVSKKYLNRISTIFDPLFLESKEAKIISSWCFDYFNKYQKAPKKQIETIFWNKSKKLEKEHAELIELILESLSNDYSSNQINFNYLMDETEQHFKKQALKIHIDCIQDELEQGNTLEAEKLIYDFKPVEQVKSNAIIPLETVEQIKAAHESIDEVLINYGSTALGKLINQAMVREALVGLIGQNKGGKTWIFIDLAIQAAKTGSKVVFFQAGDLSQAQFERRISIYYAQKSDIQKYCDPLYIPVLDCVYNQTGCDLDIREGGSDALFPFPDLNSKDIRCHYKSKNPVTYYKLVKAYREFKEHKPCYNCLRFGNPYAFKGSTWYKRKSKVKPLTWKETYDLRNKYSHTLKNVRLITYSNESLTIKKVEIELDLLEKKGFIPDVIIIDYADILEPDKDTLRSSTRDQENKKWQRARKLSQDRKILVIMGTQSDAQGFDAPLLSRKNFNEDRRKLDHMTALFGLNMLPMEKERGLMRINSILNREEKSNEVVTVFHRYEIGRPILGSYF